MDIRAIPGLLAALLLWFGLMPVATAGDEAGEAGMDGHSRVDLQLRLDDERSRLAELRRTLADKEREATRLSREIETARERLEGLRQAKAKAAEGGQPTRDLEKRIAEAEARFRRVSITAEAMAKETETLEARIRSLEKQIHATEKILSATPEAPPAAPPAPAPAPEPALPLPAPLATPAAPAADTPAPPKELKLRPDQIEASKVAERKALEARKAEQDVVSYVERRTALKTQIQATEEQLAAERRSLQELSGLAAKLEEDVGREKDAAARAELARELERVRRAMADIEATLAEGGATLEALQAELRELDAEEARYVAEAEARRAEAEAARRESIWLQSPLHPRNIAGWLEERGPRLLMVVLLITGLLFLTRLLVNAMVRFWTRRLRGHRNLGRVKRIETLGAGYDAVARFAILTGGLFLLLEEAGIDLNALLGGAAIVGVALAFGAQNLIRDYFNGFMILLEDQYELGDLVTIGSLTGTVERVNMRTTVLRDLEGKVHFIPNSSVKGVTNSTYQWANALFDIPVPLDAAVDPVMALLREEAEALRQDGQWAEAILGEPVMLGVDRLGPAAIHIKFLIRTRPDMKFPVRREMLRRIKNRFDREGIRIPDQRCLAPA